MTNRTNFYAHPTAVIDEGCKIGSGTKIWHFCHIFGGAEIGEKCNLGQNVVVHATCTIGNHVKIQNNVSIYDGVILEDSVFCGPSCVFTNVHNPRSEVNRQKEYKQTLVKRGATIGANATILCGITLGAYSFVGAGSMVLRSIPDFALVVGNPAKQIGWMCECGVRLIFESNRSTCNGCEKSYELSNGLVHPLKRK